ncbi:MAG: hypothetical protein J6Q63_01620 [Bacteroidales bacterium]|nr:hypothetical protein [Bacteroidales bacterium]
MKTIKITLTTYLTYLDKKEQLEIELEDSMAEQLEAFANGKEVTNEQLEEGLPEVYEEIDYEAYSRAHDLLIIDGIKNYRGCYEADFTKLHEMFDESGFDGDFDEWMSQEDERIAQMDTAEYAEYLEEVYGIECEMVEDSYEFTYTPACA